MKSFTLNVGGSFMNCSKLLIIVFFVGQLSIGFTEDLDNDGVKNWEDYCPNTPPNTPVWTAEKLKGTIWGLNWCGCGGKGVDEPVPGYLPPPFKSSNTNTGSLPSDAGHFVTTVKGVETLNKNFRESLRVLARVTIKSKSHIFKMAEEWLAEERPVTSFNDQIEGVCRVRKVLEYLDPIIEDTSSKIFQGVIERKTKLHLLLNKMLGNSCEYLGAESSLSSIAYRLRLSRILWKTIVSNGVSEEALGEFSELDTSLGVLLASLGSPDFDFALKKYLRLCEENVLFVNTALESDSLKGQAKALLKLIEDLKNLDGIESNRVTLQFGKGFEIFVSVEIQQAAILNTSEIRVQPNLGTDPMLGPYFQFARVKGGYFFMGSVVGSPGHQENERFHQVIISETYEIQTTEVTQFIWEMVMGTNPSRHKGENLPVTDVSFSDIETFIDKLNRSNRGGYAGFHYRLPTEAEWEMAARGGSLDNGGSLSVYFCGKSESCLESYAWTSENSSLRIQPVASKKPNKLGLYDMFGNVSEITSDYYVADLGSDDVTDPKVTEQRYRVLRGGDFRQPRSVLRSAARTALAYTGEVFGLRLVRERVKK